MAKITISEGLSWMKTLKGRHAELVALRNQNAQRTTQDYNGRVTVQEPLYDPRELDTMVAKLAREQRLLDQAIKRANAQVVLDNYEQDDKVLGELALTK
jgi:hypothetical protein